MREQVEVTGLVHRAKDEDGDEIPERYIVMQGSGKKTYHGIGPGLEVELDTARAGPFMLTIFLSGQAYKILGDRVVSFTGSFSDVYRDETADWRFEKAAWSYRAGVGLRFRWLPK